VTDPGETPLKVKQLLTEEDYRSATEKYGHHTFKAAMGAEAVQALLENLDLEALSRTLKEGLAKTNSKQKIKDLTKRLKIVESLRQSDNSASWMVL